MTTSVVVRTMVAVRFLEIAAQEQAASPSDIGRAIERVVSGFRDAAGAFDDGQRSRAVAALEAIYGWRQARIAAFLREMDDAFAVDLESSKDLIMRR